MSLNILSVAFPFAALGPAAVGGAEQVLTALDAELTRLGHRSVVIAHHDSQTTGDLLPTHIPAGPLTSEVRAAVTAAHQANIERGLSSEHFDLVHMHGIDFHQYRLSGEAPVLVTLHLPPTWYPGDIWNGPDRVQLQCVSQSQRAACPPLNPRPLPVIENGVALSSGAQQTARTGFALMLSRICPEKNLHVGLDAARMAGVPAVIAGETFPYEEHLQYLRTEINPRLGEHAQLLGPVGGAAKRDLLASAGCLLLPTLAPETSSLVAMEALAAGTPVIAFPSGAIPEIVEHSRTGFIVRNAEEMARAIARSAEIDAAVCRATAAQRFDSSRMTREYLSLYEFLIRKHTGGDLWARRSATSDDAGLDNRLAADAV